jgi:putative Ca2+/H+ antiporter (TMEM165/GDT1 family)
MNNLEWTAIFAVIFGIGLYTENLIVAIIGGALLGMMICDFLNYYFGEKEKEK